MVISLRIQKEDKKTVLSSCAGRNRKANEESEKNEVDAERGAEIKWKERMRKKIVELQ